jgi:hypothetical protein
MTAHAHKNKNIFVKLLNLDEITHSTLSYFFKSDLCKQAEISESSIQTNVYIVDQQREITDHFYKTINILKQYAIVLYMDKIQLPNSPNILPLRKPINAQKLSLLIKQIDLLIHKTSEDKPVVENTHNNKRRVATQTDNNHSHLYNAITKERVNDIHLRYKAQKYVGSNKDIRQDQSLTKRVFLTPEKYLYHHLINAKKLAQKHQSNTIIRSYSGDVYYHYSLNQFLYNIDGKKLKLIQTAPLPITFKIAYFNKTNKILCSSLKTNEASAFIWESAIQASKGRIPKNTDIHNIVRMKAWPNFPGLQIFRYAIQISALWSCQELSLYDTAAYLKIPQRYVFTLYCAMHALGYVSVEDTTSKKLNIGRKNTGPSILSKLLAHFY